MLSYTEIMQISLKKYVGYAWIFYLYEQEPVVQVWGPSA